MGRITFFRLSISGFLVACFFLQGTEASTCPYNWFNFQGHCYILRQVRRSWNDAEADCQTYGSTSHLASILSVEEHRFLATAVREGEDPGFHIWIGLFRVKRGGRVLMSLISCFHCVLLGLLATGFFPQGTEAAECPTGWLHYRAYCYGVFSTQLTWKEADEDCAAYSRRGHLASILSPSQAAMISSHLQNQEDEEDIPTGIWIGLHDPTKKGYWKWADLSILSYLPWNKQVDLHEPGTPTEGGCAYLSAKTDYAKWHVAPCSKRLRYMCRMSFM